MKTNRLLSTFLFLLTGALLFSGWEILNADFPVDRAESRMWIEGTSNLHDWECEAEQFNIQLEANGTLESLSAGNVIVLSSQLECGSNRMNRNTRDALKTDTHNRIAYSIETADVAASNPGGFSIALTGQLSLAGVQKPVDVTAQATPLADGRFRIQGSAPLLMTDFGIDPPRAMMGALRTADEATVHFDIVAGNGS